MSLNASKEAAKSLVNKCVLGSAPKTTAKRKFEEIVLAKCVASKKVKRCIVGKTTEGVAEKTGVIGGTVESAVVPVVKETTPSFKVNKVGLAIDCVVEAGFTVHDIDQILFSVKNRHTHVINSFVL